jgi:tetratricopeptide (TPR) repeat protein
MLTGTVCLCLLRFSFPEILRLRNSFGQPQLSEPGPADRADSASRNNIAPIAQAISPSIGREGIAPAQMPGIEVVRVLIPSAGFVPNQLMSSVQQVSGFAQDRAVVYPEAPARTASITMLPPLQQLPPAAASAPQQPVDMLPPPRQAPEGTQLPAPETLFAPRQLPAAPLPAPQQPIDMLPAPRQAPAATQLPAPESFFAPRQAPATSLPAPQQPVDRFPLQRQAPTTTQLPTPESFFAPRVAPAPPLQSLQQVPAAPQPSRAATLPMPQQLRTSDPKAQPPGPAASPGTPQVPPEQPSVEGAALLGLARIAVQRGEYAEAVRRFTEYLKLSPQDSAVRREYAGVLVRAGERQRAIEEYRQLLAAKPDDVPTILALSDVYVSARDFRQAATLLSLASARVPDNPELTVRLARALTFARDFLQAHLLLERILAAFAPDSEKVPRDLPALLLDMQRPGDALRYLIIFRERRPKDPAVLVDMVRAFAGIADEGAALRAIDELAALPGVDDGDKLALADTLLDSGHAQIAAVVYNQVLTAKPTSIQAQLGLARVAIYRFQPEQALRFLEAIRSPEDQRRRLQLAWGEYFQQVGQYTEGLQVYLDLIGCDPLDGEAILARAKLLQFMSEYEKAKAEYAKIQPESSYFKQGRLGIASTLFDQRRYPESIERCEKMMAESPADGETAAVLIRALVKSGDCPRAITVGRGFLAAFGRIEPVAVPVQLALGRALLDTGSFGEAAHEFSTLLARPSGRIADAWYGLSRAETKMGGPAQSEEPLLAAFSDPGNETRNRLLLADLFYADEDDHMAIDLALSVLKHDHQNLAGLIRLADAQLRNARPTAHIDDVVQTCKLILTQSPTNVRGRLALARAFGTAAQYQAAVKEYDALIFQDPKYIVPRLEKARVLYSDHKYAAACATYDAMLLNPEQLLLHGLQMVLPRFPALQATLAPLLAGCGEHALARELARDADATADPVARACLRALMLDGEARAAEIVVIGLEKDAKCLKDWRNLTAVPLYTELIHKDPNSIEGLFDVGQVFGELKETHAALDSFSQVLTIDPLNREAAIASERANLELHPRMNDSIGYSNQNGFQGLSNVARLNVGTLFTCPYGDENDTVTAGYTRVRYQFPGYPSLSGNWLTLGGSKQFSPTAEIYGVTNIEDYESRVTARPTFDFGGRWQFSDGYKVGLSAFLNNVMENGESAQQDIFRGGVNLNFDGQLSRFWHVGANYRVAYYSDTNRLDELYGVTDVLLSMPPCQVKLLFSVDYLTYSNQTVFPGNNPNDLAGATHPYFAPAGYTYAEGRIEWTQWLSRDYFVYSNQTWCSLQAALGFDDNAVPYTSVRAILNWDIKPCLSFGAQGSAKLATVYKAEEVLAYLVWRFPSRIW